MKQPMSLLLTGILCGVGLPAQAERPSAPEPEIMELQASFRTDAGLMLGVQGAHGDGLVAVIYGVEERIALPLPGGVVLEVKPQGVLAWGRSAEDGSWEAAVLYDTRYSAGLEFRLQAFSLALNGRNAEEAFRASRSAVVRLPNLEPRDTGPIIQ